MMDNKLKILVAEDDPNLGNVLQTYLNAKGYDVDLAQDGLQALEKFRTGEYNFFILDVMMPFMDGFSVAAKIREKNSEVPIIFLTAKAMQEDKMKGFEAGANLYLVKPIKAEELVENVKMLLQS